LRVGIPKQEFGNEKNADFGTGWIDPYGLAGITIYEAYFEAQVSVLFPTRPTLDKLLLLGHAKLGDADITLGFEVGITDPNFAFYLDLQGYLNLNDVAGMLVSATASNDSSVDPKELKDLQILITKVLPNVVIQQIDMDNADGDNNVDTGTDALLKFVPLRDLISGNTIIEKGISIGGQFSIGSLDVRVGFALSEVGVNITLGFSYKDWNFDIGIGFTA